MYYAAKASNNQIIKNEVMLMVNCELINLLIYESEIWIRTLIILAFTMLIGISIHRIIRNIEHIDQFILSKLPYKSTLIQYI